MSIRSGLDAQLGWKAESTFGTGVVVTNFLPFDSESVNLNKVPVEANSIRKGNLVLRQDLQARNARDATGDITLPVFNKSMGALFLALFGADTISTPGGGTLSRDHTYTLADPFGKSLTTQIGRPDTATPAVQPFTYAGCKITQAEFACKVDDFVMFTPTLWAQTETTATGLATASYSTGLEIWDWSKVTITLDGTVFNVGSFSLKIDRNYDVGRRFISGAATASEPIIAGNADITLELAGGELNNLTVYNYFANDTIKQGIITVTGSIIESAIHYGLVITLPALRMEGDTPNVGGMGIVEQKATFKALNDGTNQPITVKWTTTDTAD